MAVHKKRQKTLFSFAAAIAIAYICKPKQRKAQYK